jgi:protease-4
MVLRILSLVFVTCPLSSWAHAQSSRGATEVPLAQVAGQADATAVAVNPAQIALLRGWTLSYLHSQVRRAPTAGVGHGLFFAMPLPFGLGWGTALELVQPDGPEAAWRTPFSVALSWQFANRLALGLTSRWFFSAEDQALNGLWAVDLGLSLRLSNYLALAFTGHNLNTPRPRASLPADVDRFGRQWSAGLLVRPARRDVLSLSAETTYAESWQRLTVRGVVSLRPVPGWTIRADVGGWFQDGQQGLTLTVGTELALSHVALGGSGQLANVDQGRTDFGGFSVLASVGVDGRPVLWEHRRVVQLVLSQRLTTRSLARLQATLLRALEDPAVKGVLLTPRAGFSASLAATQDLRWVLARLRRAGKRVACYLDNGSGSGYYLCAGADQVMVNIAGGIRLTGLRMTSLYLGEALDRLGVRFEVLRLGEYKSAPEQLTQEGPSAETQEQTNAYLSSISRRYVWDLAHDRRVSTSRMGEIINDGPYLAEEAVAAGLADQAIFSDEVEDQLTELFDGRVVVDGNYAASLPRQRQWPGGPAVAVLHVEGNLVDGESFEAGPAWLRMSGARTLSRALSAARANRNIRALVVRIDSPGGSVLASDQLWRQVHRTRQVMPVVASMGGVAASGGYYMASAAHEILAAPTTLTGSIGVYYGKFQLSGLLEKIGVHPFHYRRGRRAGHNDWTRPWTNDEKQAFSQKIRTFYNRFLDRVVEGRQNFKNRAEVDRLARGRIWSGAKAKNLGLVDDIGGLQHAIERAAKQAGLRHGRYEVVHLPRRKLSLLETAITWSGLRAQTHPLPPVLKQALRTVGPLVFTESPSAQALLPWTYELTP